jgi:simple sugar transport system ATP-binding protein
LVNLGLGLILALLIPTFNFSIHALSNLPLIKTTPSFLNKSTSALGVHQASMVLKYIVKAAANGLAVTLITHNLHHVYPVGNSFTVLNRGKSLGTFQKNISREELLSMMAGGEELEKLEVELKEMDRLNT